MNKYSDTRQGVVSFLKDETILAEPEDAQILPDPQVENVWLAIGGDWAAIVYLDREDFEEVDHDEAARKYGQ